MVIAKISQGLGNQMFQYAAGKALALQKNTELKVDISGYNERSYRQFQISKLFIANPSIISKQELSNINLSHPVRNVLNKFFSKKIRSLPYEEKNVAKVVYEIGYLFRKPHRQRVYEERSFSFDSNFFNTNTDVYLKGYWMSYKYFKSFEQNIKQDFTIKPELVTHLQNLLQSIHQQDSIALHIRCTDKKSVAKYYELYGELSKEYYTKAVDEIIRTKGITNPQLYVFSDDINEAKQYVSPKYPAIFVSSFITHSPIEDFFLITQCKHVVIANSTFSWWAAYLNVHQNGLKIIPKPWYAGKQYNAKDLYVPGWLSINRTNN